MKSSFVKLLNSGGIIVAFIALILIISNKQHIGMGRNWLSDYQVAEVPAALPNDTTKDSTLPYPMDGSDNGGLYLDNPSNFNSQVEYDPVTGEYVVRNKAGGITLGIPSYMTAEEYQDYIYQKQIDEYWKRKAASSQGGDADNPGGLISPIEINSPTFDRIFGSNVVQIRPNGSATLTFSGVTNRTDNPALGEDQRSTANFDFDEEIRMNVVGQIGDKLRLQTNYDTKAQFEFQNQMKLEYTGYEDEIIKKIELGNVSLPLPGTLISGAQSLFGIKTQLQFGRTTITGVYSEQKSESSVVEVEGGARTSEFELRADQYEANRHFFLSQYFRDQHDVAYENLPLVQSGINITRVEVWVTNRNGTTQGTRNVIGYMDIGETGDNIHNPLVFDNGGGANPANERNRLDPKPFTAANPGIRNQATINSSMPQELVLSTDYEKIENARMLTTNEYTINNRLGFISLNQALNADEVLTVAFQYTLNGVTYQVGEFSTDGVDAPQVLMTKLLKSTITNVKLPLWDLMMKNVYNIGAYQVNRDEFTLDVLYANDETGTPVNYINEGPPDVKNVVLLKVLNLDNLNTNNDPQPDGVFDFLSSPVITINDQTGRVYFPVLEPFGSYLADKLDDVALADKYAFNALYDSTLAAAQQIAEKNKFFLKGTYKSASSSDIRLNAFNIQQGSVKVTAGGRTLTENEDYTVDYTLGTVKILNDGLLSSGQTISVSVENNNLFNFQTKRFMGAHVDYKVNKDFILGASILNLTEKPITNKINIGDEPISNTIIGFNGTYTTESRFLTALVDYIPLVETKAKSTITVSAEYAQLIPGHPDAIEQDNTGVSYVDDFEGAESSITLKAVQPWVIASTPGGQANEFPEANNFNDLSYGYNRAKLAWYTIDQLFWRNDNLTPDHIANSNTEAYKHTTRQVLQTEIWPFRDVAAGFTPQQPTFDVAFYPNERGPYNFDVEPTSVSAGLDADGELVDPASRWGGIMRRITTNDFEAANVEFIEFWMMDPYLENPNHQGGDLYFNLGNISEDILKDSRKAFENGLPPDGSNTNVDNTVWGRVPTTQSLVTGFDVGSTDSRQFQDIGLDGLDDNAERLYTPYIFSDSTNTQTYLDRVNNFHGAGSDAYAKAQGDPAADNFHYYRGNDYDAAQLGILDRYKQFNGLEGNSPTDEQMPDGLTGASSSQLPNVEDINLDHTLNETESYYQYKVSLRREDLEKGKNFIVDKVVRGNIPKNNVDAVWYQFRIPIRQPEKVVGGIQDFRSIRFIRMFFKDFEEPVVCRFATLDLVRGDWRRYLSDLRENQEIVIEEPNDETSFNISTVNYEENGAPENGVPYVLPPGITQEQLQGATQLTNINEQSLLLGVCNLKDGDARSAFKNVSLDMRTYKNLKMFVHAQQSGPEPVRDNDLTAFVRIGTDFSSNYYQYEVKLKITDSTATAASEIWPAENNIEIAFSDLQTVKQARNNVIRTDPTRTRATPFSQEIDGRTITVVGSPNLSNVRTIMIGIRNPAAMAGTGDDGLPKCAEIWVNELRLTDFDERGGWAANARVSATLADLARVNLAGSISTIGFGSLEKGVTERAKEEVKQYSASTNIELGKFFPEKAGVTIPVYLSMSEQFKDPQFNPLDPDISLEAALDAQPTVQERDSLQRIVQDYTKQRSFNVTNVRKQRTGNNNQKPRVYDIENFSASYAYTERFNRNINTEYNITKTYRGGLAYNYNTSPTNYKPLSGLEILKSNPNFRFLRDFNFYLLPSRVSVRADVDRYYSEQQLRNTGDVALIIDPNFNKSFNWNRVYDVKYDLARSLKVDFNATMNSRIDEPEGALDTEEKRDEVVKNFWSFGRPVNYNQTTGITWNTPINKLPYLDFASLNVRYTGNYNWTAGSLATQDELGNQIQNSQSLQYNSQFNMLTLYNKFKVLRDLSRGGGRPAGRPRGGRDNAQNQTESPADDVAEINLGEIFLKLLISIKNVSVNLSNTKGTLLPGFMPSPSVLGASDFGSSNVAPDVGFLFGAQYDDYGRTAAENGWLTDSENLNQQIAFTNSRNLTFRTTVEPFRNFRLELNANQTVSSNSSEFFRIENGEYFAENPQVRGNYSTSFSIFRTAFRSDDDQNISQTFETFKNSRITIARRLADGYNLGTDPVTGFPVGFGPTSQNVLIPAFLSAYAGKDPDNYSTDPFLDIPIPNWRISFDGFNQVPFFKERFKNISLSHAYRSSYNIGSYQTDLNYEENANGQPIAQDANNNIIAENQITQITVSEQFSPLIKVDMTMLNDVQANVEFKRDRTLSFNLTNGQLNETVGVEYVIGGGYRIKDVPLRIGPPGGRKRLIKSDLNLKADVTIRDNKVVSRKIDPEENIITSGFITIKVSVYADYVINQRLNVRLFYERNVNEPKISNSFRTANSNFGVRVQFTLAG